MKRIIAIILSVITLFSGLFCLAGCSNNNVHILTRGEWIEKLSQVFQLTECYDMTPKYTDVKVEDSYFNAIQACNEWEIIDSDDRFYPNDRADVSFAIVTSIKAVGLDKIEKSVNGMELKTDNDIINYFNNNCDVKYFKGSNLYEDTSNQIINAAEKLYATLQLKQYQDVKYTSNVIELKDNSVIFSSDGESGKITKGNFNVGDIISIEPCETYPNGKYAKIIEVDGSIIKYVEPSLEEMFDHITMYGTYTPEVIGVVPLMDGVEVTSIDGVGAEPQVYADTNQIIYLKQSEKTNDIETIPLKSNTFSLGDIDLKISATAKSGNVPVGVSGGVKLKNIKATVDLDVWGPVVKKAEIKVTDTIATSLSITGGIEKTFNLAKVPCKLWGVVGVDFVLAVKIGIEGSVSFVWSVDTSQSVEYQPFKTPKFNASGSNSNVDVELKAKAYIKPEFKAEFVIGPAAIANVGAYSGVEASAKTKIVGTSDDVQCVDINAYVLLTIFVGAEKKSGDDTLLGKLGVKKSWSIWTTSTSPWKKKWHIEEGQIVPKCTKKDKNNNKESDNNIDEFTEQENNIDLDLINHIFEIDDGLIISSYYSALDEGKTDVIKVIQLPEGYNLSSLVFSSSNSNIATVDNDGLISGNSSGVCIIKVATPDGKYEQFCSIRVLASYDVNFTPLNYIYERDMNYVFSI